MKSSLKQHALRIYHEIKEPFYLYNLDSFKSRWNEFRNYAPENVSIHYAVMANDLKIFLDWLIKEDAKLFVGSMMHLERVKALGCKSDNIVAGLTNLSKEQVDYLRQEVGTLIIGSQSELDLVAEFDGDLRLLIRVNIAEPSLEKNGIRHMGIEPAIVEKKWQFWTRRDSRLVGIHHYSGTNVQDCATLAERARNVAYFGSTLPGVKIIDIGGGFPVLNIDSKRRSAYFQNFWLEVASDLPQEIEIWTEPGRFFVAAAGFFIARVTTVEKRSGRRYIGTDACITMFPRRLIFNAPDEDHPISVVNMNPNIENQEWKDSMVVGNTTYSRDIFFTGNVPKVETGDLLIFSNAGAYSQTAMPRFLGTKDIAEIVVP